MNISKKVPRLDSHDSFTVAFVFSSVEVVTHSRITENIFHLCEINKRFVSLIY